jgi:glycosyltransferase involved in cell wall biosynthesis
MSQPTISILMPVYNGEKFLASAIDSTLAQTYPAIQLILVNDCATDNSADIIARYLPDPRITYLQNQRNAGVATSRNLALQHASGSYIAFHDQDDLWLPNKLELQMAALQQHPEIGLLHTRYARIDSAGQLFPEYRTLAQDAFGNPAAATVVGDVFEEIFISNDIQPLTSIIPKAVLDAVGWFNPDLPGVDDYELWLRIARRYPIAHLQTITGYWRQHAAQQSKQGYTMLLIRLKALDIFLAADPDAASKVDRSAFVARMHGMNRGAANHYFYNLQDYAAARGYFRKALALKPGDIDSRLKLAYCALPDPARDLIRRIKRSIKRQPS